MSSRRFLTPILIVVIVLFDALAGYVGVSSWRKESLSIENYTNSRMKSLILDLEVKIASTESVLVTESHRADYNPADSLTFYPFMEKMVQDNEFINNVGMDFWDSSQDDNPNASSITFYAARDSLERGIERGFKVVYNKAVTEDEMACYKKAAGSGMPCWSQPYYDVQFTHKYMTTCYQRSETEGVMLSADIPVENLLRSIDSLRIYDNSLIFIVDGGGERYLLDAGGALLRPSRAEADEFDSEDFIRISVHYDKLGLDIVNLVPKGEIYDLLFERILIAIGIFLIALAVLAVLVHRSFLSARSELEASMKKAGEEEMALRRIEGDISIASRIQRHMLTSPDRGVHLVPDKGLPADVFARIIPAREVGGDLYDYRLVGHKLVMCIGDVSGKGISASVLMTKCCTLFNAYVSDNDCPDPSALLRYMNLEMCRRNEECLFVTMWVGVLDLSDGTLQYSSAGHNPPVVIGGKASLLDEKQSVPLGLFDDAVFYTESIRMEDGGALLLYTDGITEAEGSGGALFGEERLLLSCGSPLPACPQLLCDSLLRSVRGYVGDCPQSDDITLLCVSFGVHCAQLHGVADVTALHTLSEECGGNYRCALALEELAVNSFEHGGASFVSAVYEDGAWLLFDDGAPFDPVHYVVPPKDDQMQIGGRGIELVRSICSEFTYSRPYGIYNRTLIRL